MILENTYFQQTKEKTLSILLKILINKVAFYLFLSIQFELKSVIALFASKQKIVAGIYFAYSWDDARLTDETYEILITNHQSIEDSWFNRRFERTD